MPSCVTSGFTQKLQPCKCGRNSAGGKLLKCRECRADCRLRAAKLLLPFTRGLLDIRLNFVFNSVADSHRYSHTFGNRNRIRDTYIYVNRLGHADYSNDTPSDSCNRNRLADNFGSGNRGSRNYRSNSSGALSQLNFFQGEFIDNDSYVVDQGKMASHFILKLFGQIACKFSKSRAF